MSVLEEDPEIFKIKLAAHENTWSNQSARAKRRRLARLGDQGISEKNEQAVNVPKSSEQCLITFDMQTKLKEKNMFYLEFNVFEISMKETLCQIVQYIRNKVDNK